MKRERSHPGIIHSELDVNHWIAALPSVERVRPGRCPACGGAGRPSGRPLGLVGHGVRERQLRGPLCPNEPTTIVTIPLRRYLCRRCGAVITVVPRGLVPRLHYGAVALGLALLWLGVIGDSFAHVRRRLSPWKVSFDGVGWATLRRWIADIDAGRLLRGIRASPSFWSAKQRAERAAMTLIALAPPTLDDPRDEARVVAGAALAA